MTPKILFTDIDGTLLNKDRELSLKTLEQIKRVNQNLSIPVILISARMPKSMRLLQAQLELMNELICYNGALVLGKNDSHVLHDEKINAAACNTIIEIAKSNELHYSLFADNYWTISKNDEWAVRETRNTKVNPEQLLVSDIDIILEQGLHKIMLMGDEAKINHVQSVLTGKLSEKICLYRSKNTYLEINPITTTKLTGMQKILSLYNIAIEDVIAIGDNHNDVDMIKHAGIGVAVHNAPDEVKKYASYICPSNIDDGVAFTIEKFF